MKWFLENWKLIVELLVLVTTLVLYIVRKRPVKVVDTIKEIICRLLPFAITEAEKTDLKGDDKKNYAIEVLAKVLCEMDLDFTTDYQRFAGEQLEVILSTPQKKGMVRDEK